MTENTKSMIDPSTREPVPPLRHDFDVTTQPETVVQQLHYFAAILRSDGDLSREIMQALVGHRRVRLMLRTALDLHGVDEPRDAFKEFEAAEKVADSFEREKRRNKTERDILSKETKLAAMRENLEEAILKEQIARARKLNQSILELQVGLAALRKRL